MANKQPKVKQQIVLQKQQRRNGHAFHPIMSKGGVHEKSNSAKRQAKRRELKNLLRDGSSFARMV